MPRLAHPSRAPRPVKGGGCLLVMVVPLQVVAATRPSGSVALMRRGAVTASAVLVLLASVITACGGEDKPGSGREDGTEAAQQGVSRPATSAQPLSRVSYRRRADRICRDVVQSAVRVRRRYFFSDRGRDLRRGFAALSASVEKGLRRLRQLGTPRGDQDAISRIQDQATSGLQVLRTARSDARLANRIVRGELDPFQGVAASARAYGIAGCVSP